MPSSYFSALEIPLHLQVSLQTLPLPWEQTTVPYAYYITGAANLPPFPLDCESIEGKAPAFAHL